MKFSVKFQDITENLRSGVRPVFQLYRPLAGQDADLPPKPFSIAQPGRVGTFWVPTNPVLSDDQGWSKTAQGDFVLVPMYSYKTASPSKPRLVASGIEIGWRAMMGGMRLFDAEPTSALLIIGHECHHTPEGYDYYVGLAVRTK